MHAVGDLLCSIGVLISATIISYRPQLKWIDPICTFIFAIIALLATIPVTKDILMILLQATPSHINLERIIIDLQAINHVKRVDDLNAYSLSHAEFVGATVLIADDEITIDDLGEIKASAAQILEDAGLTQYTVQINI